MTNDRSDAVDSDTFCTDVLQLGEKAARIKPSNSNPKL